MTSDGEPGKRRKKKSRRAGAPGIGRASVGIQAGYWDLTVMLEMQG